jgi:hypothetical protein
MTLFFSFVLAILLFKCKQKLIRNRIGISPNKSASWCLRKAVNYPWFFSGWHLLVRFCLGSLTKTLWDFSSVLSMRDKSWRDIISKYFSLLWNYKFGQAVYLEIPGIRLGFWDMRYTGLERVERNLQVNFE